MFLDRFTKKYTLGIDVSDSGVKMLALVKEGKRIRVAGFAQGVFPSEAHCDGRMVDTAACSAVCTSAFATLKKMLPPHDIPTIAGLADTHIQMTLVTIPVAQITKERVLEEASKNIPMHTDTNITDWQMVARKGEEATLFVVTTQRDASDALARALEGAGCFPSVIEGESVALARLSPQNGRHVIIDLGARTTHLTIAESDIPLFSITLPLTGNDLTETIAKSLKLSSTEAEEMKIRCGFDDTACTGALREVVRDHLDATVERVRHALDEAMEAVTTPQAIILVGGGAHLKKIDSVLTQALGIPVTLANLWTSVEKPNTFPENELGWATAMGLALRGFV